MKHTICFLLLFLIVSCNSDDTDTTITEPVPFTESLYLEVNGEEFTIDSNLYRIEDTFTIGFHPNTLLTFDKDGNFGNFFIDLQQNSPTKTDDFFSYVNYSSNYFTFNIDLLDEVNQTVSGTFSGYIYSDNRNLHSETKFISGTFAKRYQNLAPVIANLGNSAKLDGVSWLQSNEYLTKEVNNTVIIHHTVNDDPYKISIKYIEDEINVGSYYFSENTPTLAVQLSRFDVDTEEYINYLSTGTLNIVQKQYIPDNGNPFILKGNYSFTAVNPNNSNDIIVVTDGNFKLYNRYFAY